MAIKSLRLIRQKIIIIIKVCAVFICVLASREKGIALSRIPYYSSTCIKFLNTALELTILSIKSPVLLSIILKLFSGSFYVKRPRNTPFELLSLLLFFSPQH